MIKLRTGNDYRVFFTVIDGDHLQTKTEYVTNHNGEGLWLNGKQIIGNCDFNIRGVTRNTMRRRLKKAIGMNK